MMNPFYSVEERNKYYIYKPIKVTVGLAAGFFVALVYFSFLFLTKELPPIAEISTLTILIMVIAVGIISVGFGALIVLLSIAILFIRFSRFYYMSKREYPFVYHASPLHWEWRIEKRSWRK